MNRTAGSLGTLLMVDLCESSPIERAAYLAWLLANGRSLTTHEAAELTGTSLRTAQRTFILISRTVPIVRDDETFAWRLAENDTHQISPY